MREQPAVVARNLQKYFNGAPAVAGVDFHVEPGECFGFLGPNGAGKTTTMRMIYCALPPSGGELTVFGLDVRTHAREVKRRLGVVPQEPSLDRELPVRVNLLVYGRYFDIPRPVLERRADELLEFVELADKRDADVDTLSGGMQRRLLIARGLINNPDLVILDEPTVGLDPQARRLIWEKLVQLKAQGVTLILTTHYLEEAEELCDRLVIMDRGRIVDTGPPHALIEKHAGRELVEVKLDRRGEGSLAELEGQLGGLVESREILHDRVLFYTRDAAALLQRLIALGRETRDVRIRPANLEDVFLKLTGRRLTE